MIPALIAAIPALFQLGAGIAQKNKANQLLQDKTLPPAEAEALATARNRAASQLMPGQQLATENINKSASNAISQAIQGGNSSSNILATAGGINQNTNNALNQLGAQAAQYQGQQQDKLQSELHNVAQIQEQKRQEFNQAKSSLLEASNSNVFSGLSSLASIGSYAAGGSAGGAGPKDGSIAPPGGFTENALVPRSGYAPIDISPNDLSQRMDQYNPLLNSYPAFKMNYRRFGVNPTTY